MVGIYSIVNNVNKKRYIGQSIDIEERIKRHFRELRKNIHYNAHLQRSFNKYGEDAFSFEILEQCQEEDLNDQEKFWIEKFDSYNNGYNQTIGGDGVNGWKASDDFKRRISEIVSGDNNPNYGNHWSQEQKNHLSKLIKESGRYRGTGNPKATKIICIETLEVFDCIEFAREKFGFKTVSSLSVALSSPSRMAGEYHFAYYDEDLYEYLLENKFEYLCECYGQSKACKYYADLKNQIIYPKNKLFEKIYNETNLTTREVESLISNNIFVVNDIQYELLKSRLTQ